MARAARELPPKLTRLLSRGVSRIRLWGTLLTWRVLYGLKRLAVVKTSPTAGYVEAAASPGERLVELFTPTQVLILEILHDEGRHAITRFETQAGASALTTLEQFGAGKSASRPLVVRDPLAGAAFLREHARTMGKGDVLHFEFPGLGKATLETSQYLTAGRKASTGLLKVRELGTYGDIATQVAKGTPPALHGPLQLLDVVEMARSDPAVALVATRDRLIQAGQGSLPEFYKQSEFVSGEKRLTTGAALASAQVGAVASERGVARQLGKEPAEPLRSSGTPGGRYFQATRQIGLATDLVVLEMNAEQLSWLEKGAL